MPYGKTDELAINTIRTLAVRLSYLLFSPAMLAQLPRSPQASLPPSKQATFTSTDDEFEAAEQLNG